MKLSSGYIFSRFVPLLHDYHNDRKFLDRQVWANSVDPDQGLGPVWSGSTLFAIPSASFGRFFLRKSILVKFLG